MVCQDIWSCFVRALLAVVLVAFTGCGGSHLQIKTFQRVKGRPAIRAFVFLPSEYMLKGMWAYDVFDKDLDMAEHLSRRLDTAIYAADEYRIIAGAVLMDLRNETSLPIVLEMDGLAPDQAIAVRTILTENIQTGATVISGEGVPGGAAVGRAYRSTLFLELEAYHVGSNEPLATVSLRRDVDPFQEVPDHDDSPWHREILREGLDYLLEALEEQVRLPGPGRAGPVRVLTPPAEAMAFQWGELESLDKRLLREDALMRDAAVQRRVRYRHPKASLPLQRSLAGMKRGLLVAATPACAGLREGDVILDADGAVLNRGYQWRRILRTRSRPISLTVLRDGEEITLSYACPR